MTPLKFKVITGNSHEELAAELCDRLKSVVYEYSDRIPLTLAIGVIEIAKMEILEEAK